MIDLKCPLVSFVVSVYNLERYIGECLDSIIAQPFDDYEIVLVNNNSNDGSDIICKEYAARYMQIRYFVLNGEPIIGKAVVYGAQRAQGMYIHYVDGDDMLAPGAYGEIEKVLRHDAPDVVFGRFNTFIEGNSINFTDMRYQPEKINGLNKDMALEYLSETQPLILAAWRLIVSSKLREQFTYSLEHTKLPTNHQDVYVSVRTVVAARSIHYVDMPVYWYRVRASSVSRITASKQVSECCKVVIALTLLMQNIPRTEREREFIRVYIEQFCYQIAAALCTLNNEQIDELTAVIELYLSKNIFNDKDIVPDCGCVFFNILCSEGAAKGIVKYKDDCMNVIKTVTKDVSTKNGDVYLTPTGNIGLYIKTALQSVGVSVSGFFDNDGKKNGVVIDGIPILLPDAVTEIKNDVPITILIASRYANVRKELKQQFISLGVNESDLITLNFDL